MEKVNSIINFEELEKTPGSKNLVELLFSNQQSFGLSEQTLLCHQFPRFKNARGDKIVPDILIVNEKIGIVLFKVIESHKQISDKEYMSKQYDELMESHTMIYGKLFQYKELKQNISSLKVEFTPYFYCLDKGQEDQYEDVEILDQSNVCAKFDSLNYGYNTDLISMCQGFLDGSLGLSTKKNRELAVDLTETSKAKILSEIENKISLFDSHQRVAGNVILNGPQRIRGLAGSGKTVVLAMKAAQIHLNNPNALILFTFSTKSLYDQVKRLITRFYRQFEEKDPDWEKLHIRHGWGNKNLAGVYSDTCNRLNLKVQNVFEAKETFGGGDVFGKICKNLYENYDIQPYYDYIIIDEGQDFTNPFYRLCRRLVKNDRIIRGYDELQNIFDVKIQRLSDTFGKLNGRELKFSEHEHIPSDLILYKCYRNPLTLLYAAVGIGLGLYNYRVLQMIEELGYREDLGFEIVAGDGKIGSEMIIKRPLQNSPLNKEEILKDKELLRVSKHDSLMKEIQYICESIRDDIKEENLKPSDIMVICLDYKNQDTYFTAINQYLNRYSISTFKFKDNSPLSHDFKKDDYVTLTSVHRAKGNEAGAVYIAGLGSIFEGSDSDNTNNRNKLFTSMTRSNARLSISGIGDSMDKFQSELELLLKDKPCYKFEMPDMKDLIKFQRDLAKEQIKLNKSKKQMEQLLEELGREKFDQVIASMKKG